MSDCKFFYCWICAKRRLFSFADDCDGGNWTGVVCDHALWSERQHRAEIASGKARQ
jgi:hypothetical protein